MLSLLGGLEERREPGRPLPSKDELGLDWVE